LAEDDFNCAEHCTENMGAGYFARLGVAHSRSAYNMHPVGVVGACDKKEHERVIIKGGYVN
jgi:hypothetical protein